VKLMNVFPCFICNPRGCKRYKLFWGLEFTTGFQMDYLVRSALLKIKDYLNSAGCPEFLIYKPRWFLCKKEIPLSPEGNPHLLNSLKPSQLRLAGKMLEIDFAESLLITSNRLLLLLPQPLRLDWSPSTSPIVNSLAPAWRTR
jgi:hypothetical protein